MTTTSSRTAALAALAALLCAAPAAAQLSNASAAALGMGENLTAAARGFNAVAWNPAGLAMPDNPRSSFALFAARGTAGVDPVTVGDLNDFAGETVPRSTREEWLERIRSEGSQQGTGGADLVYMAVSSLRFGIQLNTQARLVSRLNPDAAELLLFGNAGRTGTAGDFALDGSSFDVAIASTAALSYAQPLVRTPRGALAIGATVKYTVGHLLASAADQGSRATPSPLGVQVRFPMIQSDTAFSLNNGSGVGLDLGLAWRSGPLSVGAAVRNVFNTFQWDEETLFYRSGEAVFDADTREADFDIQPFSTAPPALRERVEELQYKPEIAGGVALQAGPRLLVTADARHRLGGSAELAPDTHVGVGAEALLARWLPIRLGAAALDGGYQVSGGLGLRFGPVNLSAGAAQRETDLGTDRLGMFTFSVSAR